MKCLLSPLYSAFIAVVVLHGGVANATFVVKRLRRQLTGS